MNVRVREVVEPLVTGFPTMTFWPLVTTVPSGPIQSMLGVPRVPLTLHVNMNIPPTTGRPDWNILIWDEETETATYDENTN